jgi:N-acetylneuraminate synthase
MSVYVIAEAGVNHNGSIDLAYKLIDLAVEANADAVKFQTFVADSLVTKTAKKAGYQMDSGDADESQYSMLKRLELTKPQFADLQGYCHAKGIDFLSTAFDQVSLDFLCIDLKLAKLKIPSGELTNAPFVLEHARTGCDLIVSTGMADIEDIKAALSVIAFGYITKHGEADPNMSNFEKAYSSFEGQNLLTKKVTLLHCTTEYPTPLEDVNLLAIDSMRQLFGLEVGYSDHTQGIIVPVAAVALGATVIEKHFTLDCSMEGPDHSASLGPNDLKAMIVAIRATELALGCSEKKVTASELQNRSVIRKSIVATSAIKKGELYSSANIGIMRPGTGLSPYRYWEIIGTRANSEVEVGETIE